MEGIIVVDKEEGITSFDVIRKLRKILNIKKIGHCGTLDPLASGLLILALEKSTKLLNELENQDKIYVADFELGYATDTFDTEGKITYRSEKKITREILEDTLLKYTGIIKQVPPMYSAIKVNGKKLYEFARKGIVLEREAREINIEYLKILKFLDNKVKIEVKVSKGTYIRSLINDIGISLGTYATMTNLRRISIGNFNLKDAFKIEEIKNMLDKNSFDFIKNIENLFDFDIINLSNDKEEKLFKNGNTVKLKSRVNNLIYKIYYKNIFLGLGKVEKSNLLKGYKYF